MLSVSVVLLAAVERLLGSGVARRLLRRLVPLAEGDATVLGVTERRLL